MNTNIVTGTDLMSIKGFNNLEQVVSFFCETWNKAILFTKWTSICYGRDFNQRTTHNELN